MINRAPLVYLFTTQRTSFYFPYYKPANPRRLFTAPAPPMEPVQYAALQRWTQYSRSIKSAATKLGLHLPTTSLPSHKVNKRETHRTTCLKLRKHVNLAIFYFSVGNRPSCQLKAWHCYACSSTNTNGAVQDHAS
jgi:hypothetical protein